MWGWHAALFMILTSNVWRVLFVPRSLPGLPQPSRAPVSLRSDSSWIVPPARLTWLCVKDLARLSNSASTPTVSLRCMKTLVRAYVLPGLFEGYGSLMWTTLVNAKKSRLKATDNWSLEVKVTLCQNFVSKISQESISICWICNRGQELELRVNWLNSGGQRSFWGWHPLLHLFDDYLINLRRPPIFFLFASLFYTTIWPSMW